MPSTIHVRNVPDALHRSLKARAALAGMSLSDYLLLEMKYIVERPTMEDLRKRLHQRERVILQTPPGHAVRAQRNAP